jgi:hypothetical protein
MTAGDLDAGGDAELAEGLAEVTGDQADDGLLDAGQTDLSGARPGGWGGPAAAADTELARRPPVSVQAT